LLVKCKEISRNLNFINYFEKHEYYSIILRVRLFVIITINSFHENEHEVEESEAFAFEEGKAN